MVLDQTTGEPEPLIASCARRLAREAGITEVEARGHLEEVVRFLDVASEESDPCAPAAVLDRAWHVMLLDPAGYADFCRRRYGSIVHHRPSTCVPLEWYERAHAKAASFGVLDSSLWPSPAAMRPDDVADCYTGGDGPDPGPDPGD
jgi:hypothetical protein